VAAHEAIDLGLTRRGVTGQPGKQASQIRKFHRAGVSKAEIARRHSGHEPDGSCGPHPRRPCRFRPRQAGSDPRGVRLTIARRHPTLHRHL
jgi:hypothetical protein